MIVKRTTLLLLTCFVLMQSCDNRQKNKDTSQNFLPNETLQDHPLYKTYSFSDKQNVIEIGIQPFWVPTSTIVEFIKRDPILKQAMNALDVQLVFHSFLKGNDVNYFLANGNLELGIGGDMPAIRGVASNDWRVFSLIQEGNVSIISKDIREIPELKGKKIGYALGSNAHFYLLNTLEKYNISLNTVNLIQMDVTQMDEAIVSGRVDAFAAWEPTPTLSMNKNPNLVRTHSGKSYGFFYGRAPVQEQHSEVIKHILASEIRALRWLRKKEENVDLASNWTMMGSKSLKPALQSLSNAELSKLVLDDLPGLRSREYPRIPKSLLSDTGRLRKEFDLLRNIDLIPANTKWLDVRTKFNIELIESVISMPSKYKLIEPVDISDE